MPQPNPFKNRFRDKLALELSARDSIEGAAALTERLLEALHTLDFRPYEALPASLAVSHLACGPVPQLIGLLGESMRLVRSLPGLSGVESLAAADDSLIDRDASMPSGVAIEGVANPPHDRFSEEMDVSVRTIAASATRETGDGARFAVICARTVRVLQESAEALRQARREGSKWGLITAGEEGRRRSQKGLRGVIIMALRLRSPGASNNVFVSAASELQTALAVRATLMAFRQDITALLHETEALPDAEVGLLMREVRIRMVQLFAEQSYRDVRAPDRYTLQALYIRLNTWLDHVWENFVEARDVLHDVRLFADALWRINNRQTLVLHDQEIKGAALATLQALAQATPREARELWRTLSGALQALQRMRWRDASLDGLVQKQLDGGAVEAAALAGCISELVQGLGAVRVEAPSL